MCPWATTRWPGRALDIRNSSRLPPSEPIGHILDTDTEPVSDQASLEELARVLATYDLTIVPIVNESHRLVGAVTIDDVLDARAMTERGIPGHEE